MPISFNNVVIFSAGAFVTFLCQQLIKHGLARQRNIESIQIPSFIEKYNSFHAALLSARNALTQKDTSLKEILTVEFPKHRLAKIAFADVLKFDSQRHGKFNETWAKYEEAYQNVSGYDDKVTLSKLEQHIKETRDYKTQHPLQPLVKEIHDYKKF